MLFMALLKAVYTTLPSVWHTTEMESLLFYRESKVTTVGCQLTTRCNVMYSHKHYATKEVP